MSAMSIDIEPPFAQRSILAIHGQHPSACQSTKERGYDR
ncbi:hypothetical protein AWB71_01862 [Caballeronia peredens]|nr:hypothetical protein AWB71_01862 [Caballeronia peredens]